MVATREERMRRGRTQLQRILLALVLLALVSCGPASSRADLGRGEGFGAGLQAFFEDLAHRMEGIPVIGQLFSGILDGLAPGDHWCVGVGFLVLFLVLIAGVFRTRHR